MKNVQKEYNEYIEIKTEAAGDYVFTEVTVHLPDGNEVMFSEGDLAVKKITAELDEDCHRVYIHYVNGSELTFIGKDKNDSVTEKIKQLP